MMAPHDRSPALAGAIALAALLCAPAVQAQHLKNRLAEQAMEVFDHPRAAAIYEQMHAQGKAGPDELRNLAVAYRRMGDGPAAESALLRLMASGGQGPDDVLELADVMRANGKYDEALEWYGNYAALRPEDPRGLAYTDDPGLVARLLADSTSATIRTVPINSPQADLGMSILEELLLFSSARGEGAGGKRAYRWDGQPYLNLYSALLKGETAEEPMVMRKDINSRYHDGTVTYDSLAKRMYFTRNQVHYGVRSKARGGELKLGIFFSDVVTGEFGQPEWGNLIPFDHNDPEHNLGHPCISPDGRHIYFVSDMPGGLGGTDIWYSENLGNQWGRPQNMGAPVNTPGDEMHPFMWTDSLLYFASTGHPGLGGLDLFRVRLTPSGAGNVFNLGHPMNTSHNDHGLILIDDSTGFFASDRPGGLGSDDIYGCTIRPPVVRLSGVVVDKATQQPMPHAVVMVRDADGSVLARLETDARGAFDTAAAYRPAYRVAATHNGYHETMLMVDTDTGRLTDMVLEMTKYDRAAAGTVYHGETGGPLAGVKVVITDLQDRVLDSLVTDADGRYEFPLSEEGDYRVKVDKDGFFKQSARISTRDQATPQVVTDFRLFPLKVDQVVRLDHIFYDYNKHDIRPDAALELDKVVQLLEENPNVKIELGSHTDCRGRDAYNMSLSQKRAKSAVDHIISKGIAKDRLRSKGYGESRPSEDCACETCTEEQHARNRRTEFRVLSIE
ncbi:MAG: carboxypeptidase regulatory-like domain-containing protein [Flavobacteriales bacterium]|jgi:outer membrane protein OmpA-like peptidoglycan-associated protein|nr:carboxypeptidase regulatory-like domain-containing protein [Flavobacteriales bacterium]